MSFDVPTTFKIHPYGIEPDGFPVAGGRRAQATSGGRLTWHLPPGVIDLSSLLCTYRYSVIGSPSGSGNTEGLPQFSECLISRLEVHLGDVCLCDIQSYGVLFHTVQMYSAPSEAVVGRSVFQNLWTNGNPVMTTVAAVESNVFAWERWLGILGSGKALDTRGQGEPLVIHIHLMPNYATASNLATNTWGVRDCVMHVRYLPDLPPGTSDTITFDDFVGKDVHLPYFGGEASVRPWPRRKLKYIFARPVNSDWISGKPNGYETNAILPAWQVGDSLWAAAVNFSIQGRDLFQRPLSGAADALVSCRHTFGPRSLRTNNSPIVNDSRLSRRVTVYAASLEGVDGDQEVLFKMEPTTSGLAITAGSLVTLGMCTSARIQKDPASGKWGFVSQ
jgi:hypothetical protein